MRVLHHFPNAAKTDFDDACRDMEDLAKAVTKGNANESDDCISRMIEDEVEMIMRSLHPRFGLELDMERTGLHRRADHA